VSWRLEHHSCSCGEELHQGQDVLSLPVVIAAVLAATCGQIELGVEMWVIIEGT
jgi:hypothetical protein